MPDRDAVREGRQKNQRPLWAGICRGVAKESPIDTDEHSAGLEGDKQDKVSPPGISRCLDRSVETGEQVCLLVRPELSSAFRDGVAPDGRAQGRRVGA